MARAEPAGPRGPPVPLDDAFLLSYDVTVRFYGLMDTHLLRVFELHVSRAHVERELAEILADEPVWAGRYAVVVVDLGGAEPQVELV